MQCPFCHAASPPDAKFCRACGKSLTKICPHCGKQNGIAARFCVGCGHSSSSNAANDSGADAGIVSDSSQQPPTSAPLSIPPALQEPNTLQHTEPEDTASSPTSPPANASDSSANKSVSKQGSPSESVGLDADQSLTAPETNRMQSVPGGNKSSPIADSPRRGWNSIWIALFSTLIVTSAAGSYYFFYQSSASPKTDALQVAQAVEPPIPGAPAVTESEPPALSEEPAIDGFPPSNKIEGPASGKAKQIMAKGESVYLQWCSACHQENGRGLPGVFPAIDGSRIATGDVDKHILVVMNGKPGTAMADFSGALTDAEIAAVVTYQRNAWSNRDGGALLDPDYIKQFRQPIYKPQASLIPPATATRAPEKPQETRELLIGRWKMAGGITDFRSDGSSQGYRGDGSPLNSGWWRLDGDRLTIGWMRNGRTQEVGCIVLSVNKKEFLCKNEREVQRATRLTSENLAQRQVIQQPESATQDKGGRVTNPIRQIFNRELEKLKQCEGKWGTTPECPSSSWNE